MPKRRLCWQRVLALYGQYDRSDVRSSGWVGYIGKKRGSKLRFYHPNSRKTTFFCFERLSAVVPWTPLMWALWLRSLWWSFAWQQREKVGESAQDVGILDGRQSFFGDEIMSPNLLFYSATQVMVSFGVLCSFSFKSLVKMCGTVAGEFCGNGRNFFQKLSDRSDLALNDTGLVFETRNVIIFWFADDET